MSMTEAERMAVRQWRERVGRARRLRQGERLIALEASAADWAALERAAAGWVLSEMGSVVDHDPGDEDRKQGGSQ